MFYLVLPVLTLTVDPFQPALPLQDDASFPAAPRLRIWRLGVRIPRGAHHLGLHTSAGQLRTLRPQASSGPPGGTGAGGGTISRLSANPPRAAKTTEPAHSSAGQAIPHRSWTARKYEAHSISGVPIATARWARFRFGHRAERAISQSAASPPARPTTTTSQRANSSTTATRVATMPNSRVGCRMVDASAGAGAAPGPAARGLSLAR